MRPTVTDTNTYDTPEIYDDFLEPTLFSDVCSLLAAGNWRYGWRSAKGLGYGLWHTHFAGGDKDAREPCDEQLQAEERFAPIAAVWEQIRTKHLKDYRLLRAYANGQTFGLDGGIHVDSVEREECCTAILYAHSAWAVSWGGETTFYDDEGEISQTIGPTPGRLVLFDAGIAHGAKAPSRECPALRTALVFKAIRCSDIAS